MGELNKVLSGGQLAGGNSASKREENDFMQQTHKH